VRDRRNQVIFLLAVIISIAFSMAFLGDIDFRGRDSPSVNINTASVYELDTLPGIGTVLAERIVQCRPYQSVWELDRVKGIGPKTIEGIKNRVEVK